MTSSSFNPADFPDGKGPRPPFFDKADPTEKDLYEVLHDEARDITDRAVEEMAKNSALAVDIGRLVRK